MSVQRASRRRGADTRHDWCCIPHAHHKRNLNHLPGALGLVIAAIGASALGWLAFFSLVRPQRAWQETPSELRGLHWLHAGGLRCVFRK